MSPDHQFHENLDREHAVISSSDRNFGIVFSVVFLIAGCWPLISGEWPRWWAIICSIAFLGVAFLRPKLLTPLNKVWTLFGGILHKIVNPFIMGLIFYFTVVPTALVLRLLKKDPLKLNLDPTTQSYWEYREPPGPSSESIKNQF